MVHNPETLYSGGQGIFNSTPFTQFALQQEAKQKAKDEALDKYYNDLPKSINGAGMRVKDIGGFVNKINGVRDYYQQNKEAIKNPRLDNGKAQSTYQSMNTDASMDVNKSKDRALKEKAALDFHQGKLKADERLPDDFWNDLNENAASIYENPDYKGFDVQKWAQAPPAFHQDKFIQKFKDVTPQVAGVKYEAIPDNPLKQMEVTVKQFTPDQKQAIKARATDEYQNSYSFSNSVLEDLANPEKKLQLEQVYIDQFGAEPKTKNEYAAAKAIQLLQNDLVSKKPVDNLEEINRRKKADENARDLRNFEQQKEMQNRGFRHTEAMAREKLGAGDSVSINDVYKNITDATDNPNAAIVQSGKRIGTRVNTLNSDAQKVLVDYANKLRPNEKIGNDNIFIDKDADGTIKIYRTDDWIDEDTKAIVKRGVVKDEAHLIGELPKVAANLPAQVDVKSKRAVISQGNNEKPKTVKQNGVIYTWNEKTKQYE